MAASEAAPTLRNTGTSVLILSKIRVTGLPSPRGWGASMNPYVVLCTDDAALPGGASLGTAREGLTVTRLNSADSLEGALVWRSSTQHHSSEAEWSNDAPVQLGPLPLFDRCQNIKAHVFSASALPLMPSTHVGDAQGMSIHDMFAASAPSSAMTARPGALTLPECGRRSWSSPLTSTAGVMVGMISMDVVAYGWRAPPPSLMPATPSVFAPPSAALPAAASGVKPPVPPSSAIAVKPAEANCLKLFVLRAGGLSRSVVGNCPLVELRVGDAVASTDVLKGTVAGAAVEVKVEQGYAFLLRSDSDDEVAITLKNKPVFFLPAAFQGQVTFKFSQLYPWLMSSPSAPLRRTLLLRDAHDKEAGLGTVEVQFEYVAVSDVNAEPVCRLGSDGSIPVVVTSPEGRSDGAITEITKPIPSLLPASTAAQEEEEGAVMPDIKAGEWVVHVHVIEVRNLTLENWNGTASPCVYVSMGGQTQTTRVVKNQTSAVFDTRMMFTFPSLAPSEVRALTATITVHNCAITRTVIGAFACDVVDVYARPSHSYQRLWTPLYDTVDAGDRGVQGFLRFSITVTGPGDALRAPDDAARPAPAPEAGIPSRRARARELEDAEFKYVNEETTADALMLSVPRTVNAPLRWLCVTLYGAEHMPSMDRVKRVGIDAYAIVRFGASAVRTHVVTRVGDDALAVNWNLEAWLPYRTPYLSSRVEVQLWDHNSVLADELVGTVSLDMKEITASRVGLPPFYANIYGAPLFMPVGDAAATSRMNAVSSLGSTYRGRFLLAAHVVSGGAHASEHRPLIEIAHRHVSTPFMQELVPPLKRYRLTALIYSGDALPHAHRRVGVCMHVGRDATCTSVKDVNVDSHGCVWSESLGLTVDVPISVHTNTDVILYLYTGTHSHVVPHTHSHIAYVRVPLRDLAAHSGSHVPVWLPFAEDTSIAALSTCESAGLVLMSMTCVPVDAAVPVAMPASGPDARLSVVDDLVDALIDVSVYRAVDLPHTQADGSARPYVAISCAGVTARTGTCSSCSPVFNETVRLAVRIPRKLEYAPLLHMAVCEDSGGVLTRQSIHLCELAFSLASVHAQTCDAALSSAVPIMAPRWHDLALLESSRASAWSHVHSCGRMCVAVRTMTRHSSSDPAPPLTKLITPTLHLEDAGSTASAIDSKFVEITCVGARSLASPDILPLNAPFLTLAYVEGSVNSAAATGRTFRSVKSRVPSASNPNWLGRYVAPLSVPREPFYAPVLTLAVLDSRGATWNGSAAAGASAHGALMKATTAADTTWWKLNVCVGTGVAILKGNSSRSSPRQTHPYMDGDALGWQDETSIVCEETGEGCTVAANMLPPWVQLPVPQKGLLLASNDSPSGTYAEAKAEASSITPDGQVVEEVQITPALAAKRKARKLAAEGDEVETLALRLDALLQRHTQDSSAARRASDDAVEVSDKLDSGTLVERVAAPLAHKGRGRAIMDTRGSDADAAASEQLKQLLLDMMQSAADPRLQSPPAPPAPTAISTSEPVVEVVSVQPRGGGVKSRAAPSGMTAATDHSSSMSAAATPPSALTFTFGEMEAHMNAVLGQGQEPIVEEVVAPMGRKGKGAPPLGVATAATANAEAELEQTILRETGEELAKHTIAVDASKRLCECASTCVCAGPCVCAMTCVCVDARACGYLRQRRELKGELEAVLGSPFLRVPVYTRALSGFHTRPRVAGEVKLHTRVCDRVDAPGAIRAREYVVRVYVMDFTSTTHMCSRPYVRISVGAEVTSSRDRAAPCGAGDDIIQLYETAEVACMLPGTSTLTVDVWDRGMIWDTHVGRTQLELEDRVCDALWQALGAHTATSTRFRATPLESRFLYTSSHEAAAGYVRMWVDIMTHEEARTFSRIPFVKPPQHDYTLRAIVWKTRGIPAGDVITGMSDQFVVCDVNGVSCSTDTHWRSSDGRGSFNYRMQWDLALPAKYFRLHVQVWDRDLSKYSDCLGETELDLTPVVRRALADPSSGIHVFKSDTSYDPPLDSRWVGARLADWLVYVLISACVPYDAPVPAPFAILRGEWWRWNASRAYAFMMRTPMPPPPAPPARVEPPIAPRASGLGAGATESSTAAATGIQFPNPMLWALGISHPRGTLDAASTLRTLAAYAGVDVRPRHAQWVKLTHRQDKVSEDAGVYTDAGQVLMTIELLPKAVAARFPAGNGRNAPNEHPTLPPPAGRVRCSANPCYLFSACCGAKVFTACICCLIFAALVVIVVLGAPFIQAVEAWLSIVPRNGQIAVWIVLSILLGGPPLYCYCRYVICPRRQLYEQVSIDDFSATSDEIPRETTGLAMDDGAPGSKDSGSVIKEQYVTATVAAVRVDAGVVDAVASRAARADAAASPAAGTLAGASPAEAAVT